MARSLGGAAAEPRPESGFDIELGRDILLMAGCTALTQGLVRAMQNQLPLHRVRLGWIEAEPASQDDQVGLVLLYETGEQRREPGALMELVRRRFPRASIGLVVDGSDNEFDLCSHYLETGAVQGVVPLSLGLDIWLAAVSLLLSGGEYCPPDLLRRRRTDLRLEPASQDSAPRATADTAGLTSRELEVLELMSHGYQNKLIADHMELSEHTVKVHVHNIISKLRVTNRTQAAATFRGKGARHAQRLGSGGAAAPASSSVAWRSA